MVKHFYFTWLFLIVSFISFSQNTKGLIDISKVPAPQWHYQEEYTFDSPSDPQSWEKLPSGLHAGFGSTNELYLRSEIPKISLESEVLSTTSWRGQRINAQVLVWSPDSLEQIRFEISNLEDNQGNIIQNSKISTKLVRYVISNFPYNGYAATCDGPLDSVWLMPDRFESFERFNLPGKTVRPVWLSVDIPETAIPGIYTGNIEIISSEEKQTLQIEIEVQDLKLPKPKDWNFRLDLWQNPWVVAEYFNVEPWSDEHKMLLKKHMKLYADAGGTFISTYAVHSPWSDNSYTVEGGMIDWIKNSDGTWTFDYTIFDQYVELCMEMGINEAITIYTPVPWGNRFRYKDGISGNYVYENWPVDTDQFKTNWTAFLDDLNLHLHKNKWFEKTYIGINENPLEVTFACVKIIKEHSEDWKITYAGDWHPELTDLLDDYSLLIPNEPNKAEVKNRTELGFTTSFYVCCNPAKPNNFVFSPPVEGQYIGWYSAANGYDGFLRWAYDAWPADPQRDARHTLWPAGDCFMVYPGGNSCVRYEKLREGIVDFEKIKILMELGEKSNNSSVKELMKKLEKQLESFEMISDYNKRDFNSVKMENDIKMGELIINQLSKMLAQ